MAWLPVTDEEAQGHPLYGFGGWLYVMYAVALFGVSMTLYTVIKVVQVVGMGQLASPAMGFVWLHLVLNLPFLVMAPMLARAMPTTAIICYWVGILLGVRVFFLPGLPLDMRILGPMGFWFAWGVVFTLYLLRSHRVNVTYLKRVLASEEVAI
jgi:hypothetical protein